MKNQMIYDLGPKEDIVAGATDVPEKPSTGMIYDLGDKPTFTDKVKYGWDAVSGFIASSFDLAEQQSGQYAKLQDPEYHKAKRENDYEALFNVELKYKQPDEILNAQIEQRKEEMKASFPNIYGTGYAEEFAVSVGSFGKFVADPTTLIPIGSTYKAAAFLGGVMAGADVSMNQLAKSGEVDARSVAIAAAIGVVAGPLFLYGGQKFVSWISGKKEAGAPVTADELEQKLLEWKPQTLLEDKSTQYKNNIIPADTRKLADLINEKMGLTLEKRTKNRARADMKAALKDDPEMTEFFANYSKVSDNLRGFEKLKEAKASEQVLRLKEAELESLWTANKSQASAATAKAFDDLDATKTSQVNKAYDEQVLRSPPPARESVGQIEETMVRASHRRFDNDNAAASILKDQAGNISTNLIAHMGSAGAGAAVGYGWGGPEGAAVGLMVGGGLAYGTGKLYQSLGKLGDKSRLTPKGIINTAVGNWITSPARKLSTFGNTGKHFSRKLEETEFRVKELANKYMGPLEKRFANMSTEEMDNISRVQQGIAKPISNSVRKASIEIKKDFNAIIDLSVKHGIVKPEAAAKLKAKSYWPRIYNDNYLSTKAGQSHFVKVLSEEKWTSEKAIRNAMKHILNAEDIELSDYLRFIKKDGNVFTITRDGADRIMRDRKAVSNRSSMNKKRSSHLEKARTLNVQNEEVLRPFLLTNPHTVLTEYFWDVSKRIEFARSFGANDSKFDKMAMKIKAEAGDTASDYATNAYYTSVGDSRSSVIRSQINQGETERRLLGSINAYETLNLTLSQILNLNQATVNGIAYLSSEVGFTRAINAYRKGLTASFTKEGIDFSLRSAAAIESTLLQLLNEGAQANTISGLFGKGEITGALAFLDVLNNPTKFLRAVGFIKTEQMQRILAANMAKANFEDLLARKAAVESGEITGRKAVRLQKEFDSMLPQAFIDPSKKAAQYTERDFERFALYFSDKINHTNDVSRLPLPWRTPYAKMVMKFKSFSFYQGNLINDRIILPIKENALDPKPYRFLLAYMGVGTPMGMAADEIRRIIASDDAELTNTQRVIRGFMSVGGLGVGLDATLSFLSPYAGSAWGLAGPAINDLYQLGTGAVSSYKNESIRPFVRSAAKTFMGNYPYKKQLLDEITKGVAAKRKGSRGTRRVLSRTTGRSSGRSSGR